jgi:hypothetical protein
LPVRELGNRVLPPHVRGILLKPFLRDVLQKKYANKKIDVAIAQLITLARLLAELWAGHFSGHAD